MSKRTRLIATVVATLAALTVSSCSATSASKGGNNSGGQSSSADAGAPQHGGTLTMALPEDITRSLNPHGNEDPTMYRVVTAIYERLVNFAPTEDGTVGEVEPGLATSWDVSKDNLTYTFHLRKGVHWQNIAPVNGREFTSADVVASFKDLEAASKRPGDSGERPLPNHFPMVKEVTAPDKYTVVFTLSHVYAPFLNMLADRMSLILPQEGIEKKYDMSKKVIGTGPFMLARHKKDVEWVLKRNPTYWDKPKPYLDELHIVINSNQSAVVAALTSGRVDIGGAPDLATAQDTVKREPSLRLDIGLGFPITTYLNPKFKPFSKLKVRQAIGMAINFVAAGKKIRGKALQSSIVPPFVPAYALTPEEIEKIRPYDPEKAKQLLAEAGYPNGFKLTLEVQKLGQADVSAAQWWVDDLKKVGIDVTLKFPELATAVSNRINHKFQMTRAARSLALPDQYLLDFMPGSVYNYSDIKDPKLASMIQKSETMMDPTERAQYIKSIQTYFEKNVATAIYSPMTYRAGLVNKRVHDLKGSPIIESGAIYKNVWVSKS
jgi:ABC-type transport system substrate-binding protein